MRGESYDTPDDSGSDTAGSGDGEGSEGEVDHAGLNLADNEEELEEADADDNLKLVNGVGAFLMRRRRDLGRLAEELARVRHLGVIRAELHRYFHR